MNHFDPYMGQKAKKALPLGYEQTLKMSTQVEQLEEDGTWSTDTYTREVEITYLGMEFAHYAFHVSCDESSYVLKNKVKPHYDLLMEVEEAFDELVLLVDLEGNIVKINNFTFVKERWMCIKEELSNDYDDAFFQQLCERMDAFVDNYEAVFEYIKSPAIYGLYFNGYWGKHEHKKFPEKTVAYGSEAQGVRLVEMRSFQHRQSAEQEYVELLVTARPEQYAPEFAGLHGRCQYVDGILYQYIKKVTLTHKTITYTARWDGLRKRIQ